MEIGELDQRITLHRSDLTPGSSGARIEDPVPVLSAWASVEPVGASEADAGDVRVATSTYRFRTRYRSGIDATWRVEWRGAFFDIASVTPGGERLRDWIDIVATSSPAMNPEE